MFDKGSLSKSAELFLVELGDETYQNQAGLKDSMNTAAIYRKYSKIFTIDNLNGIESALALEKIGDETRKQLLYLRRFIAESYMGNETRTLNDEIATKSSQAVVDFDGEDIPYRYVPVKIINEDNHDKRIALERAREVVVSALHQMRARRLNRIYQIIYELGYKHYLDFYTEMKGFDIKELSTKLDGFIERTDSIYSKHLVERLQKLRIPIESAERADMGYVFRAKELDAHFNRDSVLAITEKTLLDLGIDLNAQKNIILDIEVRKKKSPRAFCMPIVIPDKIYLVTMPRGGLEDYKTMLHEMGHAQHFGNTDKTLPFEYKYLGDVSVSETYSFLFEYLTADSYWVERNIKMKDKTEYLRFVYFWRLYMLRRYAAKLRYEIKLHICGLDRAGELYSETMNGIMKFKHPMNHCLDDLDDGFYSAQYLRAWFFEAQLRSVLKKEFGEHWFTSPNAGKYLKDLWAMGSRYNIEELARHVGQRELDTIPLEMEIKEALRN